MKRPACWLMAWSALACGAMADDLSAGFEAPPGWSRPWVYWFPLSGNLTREGITADLEAMARAGVGGVLYMETDQGAPKGEADFAGPLWMELLGHAYREAGRLGLQVNMNNDAGWCGSGGPWITPELSMQKVVWTEAVVERAAGVPLPAVQLPRPEAVRGFYQDIAVLAMPAPAVDARVPGIAGKALFTAQHFPPLAADFAPLAEGAAIERGRVVDLTAKLDGEGGLRWEAPPGKWLVMRIGHTSTGQQNHPAPESGRGLECDKLSREAAAMHFGHLMGRLIEANGGLAGAGKVLVSTHIDSWEVGSQNWTPRMREEFQRRRGYDLLPFLPVFSGRFIDGNEVTERFLWDLRLTISELLLENYAGTFRELAARHGLRLSIEGYDGVPVDELAYAGRADEPMGEFWSWGRFGAAYTCTAMTSAAHVYGKPVIGAEAFTADSGEKWLGHPGNIKDLGDWAFCEGINRFVFHRYAAQPWVDRAPGMSMGPWGLHYERTQTWWEQSKAWHRYLARCQYLLQQGRFVADIAYLTSEGAPRRFAPPAEAWAAPNTRGGYNFDGCPPEAVLTRMSVKDGRLVLPDGMNYRVLVVPEAETMTPALLRKLGELADAGATIVAGAEPPRKSPSLADRGAGDDRVREAGAALWASGRILTATSAQQVLAGRGVPPDFAAVPLLRHTHRSIGGAEVYFVANPQPRAVEAVATFRVSGRRPELWWPDDGRIEGCVTFEEAAGVTRVRLRLDQHGSVFVVFREPAAGIDRIVALSRDGEPLWSFAAKPAAIKVLEASYGVAGDPARTRDVTAAVQQLVDAGERSFQVARLADGGDPAHGVVKTLTVRYAVGDTEVEVGGRDPDTVHINADAAPVRITKAVYGVPGDAARSRDVTAKVQRLVDAGERSFEVARLAQGDDPAFGVVKTLAAEYLLDGRPRQLAATDPELADFGAVAAGAPVAELSAAGDGRPLLTAWQPGSYRLQTASGGQLAADVGAVPAAQEVSGPWRVRFDPRAGGPGEVEFATLDDWSRRPEDGIRYYSGTADYRATFELAGGPAPAGMRRVLDLGRVGVMAAVKLNGEDLGTLWKPPFRVDVTRAARAGTNVLEVEVVNLWVNRQIGDEHLPEDSDRNPDGTLRAWPDWLQQGKPSPTGRLTFTSWRLWHKDDPLQPSGLIGPVVIHSAPVVAAVPAP